MLKSKRNWLATSIAVIGLTGCGASGELSDGIEIHKEAIKKVALTYGAQSGLAWESERINKQLNHYSRELDAIYDFNFLLMYRNVLPPVIEESYLSYNIANTKEVRLADKEIKRIHCFGVGQIQYNGMIKEITIAPVKPVKINVNKGLSTLDNFLVIII